MSDERKPVELFQLVGSVLRDLVRSRYTTDLYSRQLSFGYEKDPVLRRFPVPRIEIEEAEVTLHFGISDVSEDSSNATSAEAQRGALFGQYGASIARGAQKSLLDGLTALAAGLAADSASILASYRARVASDTFRDNLADRIFRYFNESAARIVIGTGQSQADPVKLDAAQVNTDLARDVEVWSGRTSATPELLRVLDPGWGNIRKVICDFIADRVDALAKDIAGAPSLPDFKINVDFDPETLGHLGSAVSSITLKTSVKNYSWAKVDVDADSRNIRTLNKEA